MNHVNFIIHQLKVKQPLSTADEALADRPPLLPPEVVSLHPHFLLLDFASFLPSHLRALAPAGPTEHNASTGRICLLSTSHLIHSLMSHPVREVFPHNVVNDPNEAILFFFHQKLNPPECRGFSCHKDSILSTWRNTWCRVGLQKAFVERDANAQTDWKLGRARAEESMNCLQSHNDLISGPF